MPRDQSAGLVGPALIPQPSCPVQGMKASVRDLWAVSDGVQPGGVGDRALPLAVQQMTHTIHLASDARGMTETRPYVPKQPVRKDGGAQVEGVDRDIRGVRVDEPAQSNTPIRSVLG